MRNHLAFLGVWATGIWLMGKLLLLALAASSHGTAQDISETRRQWLVRRWKRHTHSNPRAGS